MRARMKMGQAGWWCGRIRDCGYRTTLPRQALLDVLSRTDKHMSADEIYFALNKYYPNTGLATIYRNLEMLFRMGLVSKLNFGDGRSRYEIIRGPQGVNHHHHLVCTGCGAVIDYADFINEEVELLNKTQKALSKKYGFNITDHFIQFSGLCGRCKDKGDK
ncbi:MAG TPA: transcriptional repressor [Candidatus Omnitrophica bacterium]|nr:transcriptional repressor [Candidatus Omnitrophota bacterium]